MNNRRRRLPELILARLSVGAVPIDGIYWFERQGRPWIDRARERELLHAGPAEEDAQYSRHLNRT